MTSAPAPGVARREHDEPGGREVKPDDLLGRRACPRRPGVGAGEGEPALGQRAPTDGTEPDACPARRRPRCPVDCIRRDGPAGPRRPTRVTPPKNPWVARWTYAAPGIAAATASGVAAAPRAGSAARPTDRASAATSRTSAAVPASGGPRGRPACGGRARSRRPRRRGPCRPPSSAGRDEEGEERPGRRRSARRPGRPRASACASARAAHGTRARSPSGLTQTRVGPGRERRGDRAPDRPGERGGRRTDASTPVPPCRDGRVEGIGRPEVDEHRRATEGGGPGHDGGVPSRRRGALPAARTGRRRRGRPRPGARPGARRARASRHRSSAAPSGSARASDRSSASFAAVERVERRAPRPVRPGDLAAEPEEPGDVVGVGRVGGEGGDGGLPPEPLEEEPLPAPEEGVRGGERVARREREERARARGEVAGDVGLLLGRGERGEQAPGVTVADPGGPEDEGGAFHPGGPARELEGEAVESRSDRAGGPARSRPVGAGARARRAGAPWPCRPARGRRRRAGRATAMPTGPGCPDGWPPPVGRGPARGSARAPSRSPLRVENESEVPHIPAGLFRPPCPLSNRDRTLLSGPCAGEVALLH